MNFQIAEGLRCVNAENEANECVNFEVRFFCKCGKTTTISTATASTPTLKVLHNF